MFEKQGKGAFEAVAPAITNAEVKFSRVPEGGQSDFNYMIARS